MTIKHSCLAFPTILIFSSLAAETIEEVNVTAYRVAVSEAKVGATTLTLDAESLRQQGIQFISDALAEISSISVSSTGSVGSLTQVKVRGQEANHTLVLLDGIRISDPVTGGVDFANLRLDDVAKIEIVFGPQSLVYGADALGGVINIVTTSPEEGFTGSLSASTGTYDTQNYTLNLSGSSGVFFASLALSDYQTDGISAAAEAAGNTEEDGYQSDTAHLKLGVEHNGFRLWGVYHTSNNDVEFDTDEVDGDGFYTGKPADEPDGFNNKQIRQSNYSLIGLSNDFTETLSANFTWANSDDQTDITSYYPASEWGPEGMSHFSSTGSRQRSDLIINYRPKEGQTIQLGADTQEETVSTTYFVTESNSTKGTYLQWLGRIGIAELSAGLRRDDNDAFGQFTTYRATLSYPLTQDWRILASYGTGFKAPTLAELYDVSFGGNPELQPEESQGGDLGIEYRKGSQLFKATWFDQSTDNLIRYVGMWPTAQNENIDHSEVHGLELAFTQTFSPGIDLNASYTYLDATETRDTTTDATRVPDNKLHIGVDWQAKESTHTWLRLDYVGDRLDYNWAYANYVELNAYLLASIGVNYRPIKSLKLQFSIDNLTDEEYELAYGYGTLGRTFNVLARYNF